MVTDSHIYWFIWKCRHYPIIDCLDRMKLISPRLIPYIVRWRIASIVNEINLFKQNNKNKNKKWQIVPNLLCLSCIIKYGFSRPIWYVTMQTCTPRTRNFRCKIWLNIGKELPETSTRMVRNYFIECELLHVDRCVHGIRTR